MKRLIILSFLVLSMVSSRAQRFSGQWKGEFEDNSSSFVGWGGERCDYVLELECKGKSVTGYSYTYFYDQGKKYFTICKVTGFLNTASKYIEVREFERTKTNVPVEVRNCFQIHKLYYDKLNDSTESLEGRWIPAPNQEGDCGRGTTTLIRRALKKSLPGFNNTTARVNRPTPKPVTKPKNDISAVLKDRNRTTVPPIKNTTPSKPVDKKTATLNTRKNPVVINPIQKPKPTTTSPVTKNDAIVKDQPKTINPVESKVDPEKKTEFSPGFERRNNKLEKTVEIENETFQVELYDNGEIDGDSISLFFNGKLLLSHKRLTDKAITLSLNVDKDRYVNELVMYAENLGEIPPNTALMVVTDGKNRYEVFISSDLQQSGVIRFIHKLKNGQ